MHPSMTGWTQALLSQHALLVSRDVEEVRSRVAALLNDHHLTPHGATLTARLHGVQADALSLWRLEYGDAVTVEETRPGGDFLLVQMPLSGSVDIQCEEGHWAVRAGSGLILPSHQPHRLLWEAGAAQIILKVPLSRLQLEYQNLTGTLSREPLTFDRQIRLEASDGEQWSALLRYFCEQLAHPSPLGAIKIRMAEQALIRHLLVAQSLTLREHLLGEHGLHMPRVLQRARDFMQNHLRETIGLDDIARHSGASPRNLSRLCQQHYGVSPMQLLRDLRLDAIRQALIQTNHDRNVSEIALHWGYTHLGRFAAAYKQRFGQTPQETRRFGRANRGSEQD
ncbi:MAG TPA: AraC family transcriptional regulator [Alcaligenes sp.]|nr:AraC family transcriptional regulator [Alcaligenes sp.]HRL28534.1 AraC family transcriptional regulator [Alcaligenes sp.]